MEEKEVEKELGMEEAKVGVEVEEKKVKWRRRVR